MRSIFFFLTLPLFGFYVGNPADPAIMNTGFFSVRSPFFKFTSGYIYDYTSNKRYEPKNQIPEFSSSEAVKKFDLHSQLASFSFIFLERLQLFGTAGGTKEGIEQGKQVTDWVLDFASSYHFSWSTGAKVILVQWGQTFLSTDFTYFAVPSSQKAYFKFLNRLNLPLETEKQKLSLEEWQVSLGLSSRFFFLTPYGGVTYLDSDLHIHQGPDIPALNYQNQVRWGFFYGITASLTGRFHLNFERRVRDEFAYTFSTIAVF